MRSKDFVQKGVNGSGTVAQLSISVHTENGLQVRQPMHNLIMEIHSCDVNGMWAAVLISFAVHLNYLYLFTLYTLPYPTFTFGLLQTGHTNSLFKCIHSHLRVHRYFIYGLQDAQHLERVKLDFQMFEIQKGEHKDKDKEYVVTFIHLPQMHLYNILI